MRIHWDILILRLVQLAYLSLIVFVGVLVALQVYAGLHAQHQAPAIVVPAVQSYQAPASVQLPALTRDSFTAR